MSNAALQKAVNCLQFIDIWQREASAELSDYLEALGAFPENHDVLYKHVVLRSLWGGSDDGDPSPYVFRVQVALGAKLVEQSKEDDKKQEIERKEEPMLAQIEAVYVAEYTSDTDPGQEALKAFALHNASFHIWPYWREYLASQCQRMNLPKINLPLRSFASNRERDMQE